MAQAPGGPQGIVNLAIVAASVALALAGALWAVAEHRAAKNNFLALQHTNSHARALVAHRDTLLLGTREGIFVWGKGHNEPLSFNGGAQLLESCLAGPDALTLNTAVEALTENGTAFSCFARSADGARIALRGLPTGGQAVIYLRDETEPAAEIDFRGALDVVPVPAWIRDENMNLVFVNRAFLALSGASSPEVVLRENVALDRSERDLAGNASNDGATVEAKRYAVLGGQRRALSFALTRIGGGAIAGTALDLTRTAEAEARIQQHADANADILDRLATAVAIFGPDRRLSFYNRAYVRLWQLPESWLNTHPTEADILDKLLEQRRLPEQPDFRAWKNERLKLFERPGETSEEQWHLPSGQTLSVATQPHPLGGLVFLYEDVSNQLRLASDYNQLIKTQKATLDTLREGVAVFGPDGRMRLCNAAFAQIWGCTPEELAGEPHLRRIAASCSSRYGSDSMWDIVLNNVTSAVLERRREYGEINRSDGTILSLTIAPLPDGATLVSFVDVTDHSRIESALRERNQALERADDLKTEFVGRVSH